MVADVEDGPTSSSASSTKTRIETAKWNADMPWKLRFERQFHKNKD